MNRKQRRAARSATGVAAPGRAAAKPPPQRLADLFDTAMMHHHAGALADAERCYRQLIAAFPGQAEAHSRLGAVLMRQGKMAEAVAQIERALALKPDMFEAHGNLAQAYMASGQGARAAEAAGRALELKVTPQTKAMFVQSVAGASFAGNEQRYRRLLARALAESWTRPRELTRVAIALIKLDPSIKDAVARGAAAWPARLPANALWESQTITALTQHELLGRLLECDPIPDLGLEHLLTNVRDAMRQAAAERGADERLLGFCCSLARQCFINEYVFATTEAEADAAQQLRAAMEVTLAEGKAPAALWLAIAATYFPLYTLNGCERLLTQSWPPALDALITQQVREPAQEQRIAAAIPALTGIDDAVSRAVRAQYEENPYPRWTFNGTPAAAASPPGQAPAPRDALIAGCGTGLSTVEFARQARATRILAVDLSLASLRYAKRMADKLGLGNVEFAQADILRLGLLARQFDFIDSSGVLHHMADPWAGWRILVSLLRPGGVMQISLYSELGRRNIVDARAFIAARGYQAVADDIRRCRQDIAAAADARVASVAERDDFFTLSECRDLLFHVQEHRMTLPQIESFLVGNGLEFGGFFVDAGTRARFAARFPQPQAERDLGCWHAFETQAPGTFAGMYQFSVRKRAATAPQA
jgi:SAM-dependent methyltransferase/tetratricopeptide (TPR) repeat protein